MSAHPYRREARPLPVALCATGCGMPATVTMQGYSLCAGCAEEQERAEPAEEPLPRLVQALGAVEDPNG